MRTFAETIANLRNSAARSLATRPLPEVTQAALAHPLHTRVEVDETLAVMGFNFAQVADYFARLRAGEALAGIDMDDRLRAYMRSADGQRMLLALLATDKVIDDRINAIVTERLSTATIQTKHHWHKPSLMSWLGALLGGIVGAIISYFLNVYVFVASTIDGTVEGKRMVIGDNFDTTFGTWFIFGACVLVFAAIGAALLQREDRDDQSSN